MAKRDPSGDPPRARRLFDDDPRDDAPGVSLTDWLVLVLGALRRRRLLTAAVFLLGVVATVGYYRTRAPSYRVEARILAQRQMALPSLGRIGGEDNPARTAWELIHRRDNLASLARQVGLLDGGAGVAEERGLGARLLDLLRPPRADVKEAPVDQVVRVLDQRLQVTVEDGTIQLQLDWPDGRQAYHIVQAALQGFLEARHLQEVTAVDEVIAQLQGRTVRLKADLDAAVESARRRAPAPVRAAPPRERQPSEELARLRSLLEAKARAVQDVEEFRRRRLVDLESQLTQARGALSEAHPTVQALRRDIEALSIESPNLLAIREEERRVRGLYASQAAKEGITPGPVPSPEPTPADAGRDREEDPRVRDLRLQYEQTISRVTAAQLELDAVRAAFKYRYNVVWPPEIPADPRSPSPARVLGLGLLLSLLLAGAAAVAPDLLRGRVVERWQVERELDLTVLGETTSDGRAER
jgi:hypothetical protein